MSREVEELKLANKVLKGELKIVIDAYKSLLDHLLVVTQQNINQTKELMSQIKKLQDNITQMEKGHSYKIKVN